MRVRHTSLFRRGWSLLLVTSALPGVLAAQTGPAALPHDTIALSDLSAFRTAPPNWRVGSAATVSARRQERLDLSPGTGVLVNVAPSRQGEHLVTRLEHGDLEMDLEFMMPRGSNSGIYLQGRYEIQLLDSWGVKEPGHGDVGGIYQRWDPARGPGREGFEGHAPRVNAGRAPGLWQKLRIEFRAPRFDAQGRKTENARFTRVVLNGVVIHENVELLGPTRSPHAADERPLGPLVIQGDHGPVALRRIRYRTYTDEAVRLSDLRYRFYEGQHHQLADYLGRQPAREAPAEGLTGVVAGIPDQFALAFQGALHAPVAGKYLFELRLPWVGMRIDQTDPLIGTGRLSIGGREVLVHAGVTPSYSAEVELPAGRHAFTLDFFKNRRNQAPAVQLFVEGPGLRRQPLHVVNALPPGSPAGMVHVDPARKPVVLRSFVNHPTGKRTHAVSVGDPAGVHYGFDLNRGALLHAWRGPFVEASEMWHSRGDEQIAEPRGSAITLPGTVEIALLPDERAAWPDSVQADAPLRFRGYGLDGEGRPVFRYTIGALEVEDRVRPAADGLTLTRELHLRASDDVANAYVRLAEGAAIRRLSDGSYAVDEFTHYVAPGRGSRPVIRDVGGRQELLLPLRFRGGEAKVSYTLIW